MEPNYERVNDNATPLSTEDMLQRLCKTQQVTIASLREDLDETIAAGIAAAAEYERQSAERVTVLRHIHAEVVRLKHHTETVLKQRDVVEQCLRSLLAVIPDNVTALMHQPTARGYRAAREQAAELITLIDQAKAAAAANPTT